MARHPLPYQKTIIVVCLIGFLICLALIFSGCSYAVVGAGVSDFASTQYAISKGASEQNPAMQGGAVSQAIKKAAGISGVLASAAILENKGQKTLARIVRWSAIAAWTTASVINVRVATSAHGGR